MFNLTVAIPIQARKYLSIFLLIVGGFLVSPTLGWGESGKNELAKEFFAKGLGYYWAQDVSQHYEEAFVWLSKAAEYDHPRAQAILADMLSNGLGTGTHLQKSLAYALASAQQGDVFGQFLMGMAFYKGLGVPADQGKGIQVFAQILDDLETEAESGDGHAQAGLAWIYYNLSSANRDFQKAHNWYEKSAVQGYSVAQSMLGLMFGRGDGVRQNAKAEIVWYRRAAEQGSPIGQFNLALALGDQGDFEGEYTWARRAADLRYAEAEYLMGQMFENGDGRPVDLQESFTWYQKAAEQGYALAQLKLGEFYQYGNGREENFQEAKKWYEAAAENGEGEAMANLGHFYEHGVGIEKDYAQARMWYERGAALANSYSQSRLGYLHMQGHGVEKDFDKAHEWLRRAARGGDEWAYYGIGLIYEEKQEYSKAIGWYLLSAINGYDFGFKRAVYLLVVYPVISFQT
ncbi:tetratricopeptide repeat protein [Candidatus Nitronereus thalassa]|uniref:Tetratricopeptide repeat protein n=1 Tax=Candidatus Nitronereus thalassa TaxID=3020898 RepID=A0ABU3K6W7_9BACT|nr:tetratricopeptide repeat protein [Candidatus Nitronereus thalassa]MDT7042135.1 tetratricopeptide repeat protein [Candidatus Nitronereus thalassa]